MCCLSRHPDRVDSIVAAHPGLLQTELAHKWLHNGCPRFLRPVGLPVIDFLFPKVFLPPEYAVQTILRAATDPAEKVRVLIISFVILSCHGDSMCLLVFTLLHAHKAHTLNQCQQAYMQPLVYKCESGFE